MLSLLIRKEIAEIVRSAKFVVTFSVMATLILLAFVMGAVNYRVGVEEYEAAEAESRRQMEGVKVWSDARTSVFLKPEPLHALVLGVANDIGRAAHINQRGWPQTRNSRYNADTIYAVFRLIDLQFIFAIVLSLFAVLFAFDAVNGEKESGTLALVMANPLPKDQFLVGKAVGMFLALGVPLLIPILVGALMLPLLGVPMQADDWLRLALIVSTGMLYVGAFVMLSLLASTLTPRSSTSFLFMLVFWIVAVLITPRLAVMVSGRMVDVPSVDEIEHQTFAHSRERMKKNMEVMNDFWRNVDHEVLSQDEVRRQSARMWQELQAGYNKDMEVFVSKTTEQTRNRERERQKLSLNLSRVSPAAAVGLATSTLAGSSLALRNRFDDEVREFYTRFNRFVLTKMGQEDPSLMWNRNREDLEDLDPSEMPVFTSARETTSSVIERALPDIAILLLTNVLSFFAAVLAFRRYDVRY